MFQKAFSFSFFSFFFFLLPCERKTKKKKKKKERKKFRGNTFFSVLFSVGEKLPSTGMFLPKASGGKKKGEKTPPPSFLPSPFRKARRLCESSWIGNRGAAPGGAGAETETSSLRCWFSFFLPKSALRTAHRHKLFLFSFLSEERNRKNKLLFFFLKTFWLPRKTIERGRCDSK
jgi:hypothetical protein